MFVCLGRTGRSGAIATTSEEHTSCCCCCWCAWGVWGICEEGREGGKGGSATQALRRVHTSVWPQKKRVFSPFLSPHQIQMELEIITVITTSTVPQKCPLEGQGTIRPWIPQHPKTSVRRCKHKQQSKSAETSTNRFHNGVQTIIRRSGHKMRSISSASSVHTYLNSTETNNQGRRRRRFHNTPHQHRPNMEMA